MKTCATCIYWQRLGTTITPRRIVHDHRVQIVPPGEEGTCRAGPPIADNRWPLTMAGDWCGQQNSFSETTASAAGAGQPAVPNKDSAPGATGASAEGARDGAPMPASDKPRRR